MLNCGLCCPERKVVFLGISYNLVEFDLENMKITKNVYTKGNVHNMENANEETFLIGDWYGNLKLIGKKDLTCLSNLKVEGISSIPYIENLY